MSRQLRLEYPGAYYHVMSHGTGKLWIYKSDKDFEYRIVEKFELSSNNAVCCRVYRFKKKIKKDKKIKRILTKIET